MLEAIEHKFPTTGNDDLQWPLLTSNGSALPPSQKPKSRTLSFLSDDDDEADEEPTSLKSYWDFIASKYHSQLYEPSSLASTQVDALQPHWTIISITLTSDENTLFLTRQRANSEPLIFCVPLKNRREADDEDEDKLTYQDAMNELKEIIRLSDEGTRDAVNVKRDDKNARAQWWAMRSDLDKRMKSFLENLEFCWLGAFKVCPHTLKLFHADNLIFTSDDTQRTMYPVTGCPGHIPNPSGENLQTKPSSESSGQKAVLSYSSLRRSVGVFQHPVTDL